MNGKNRVCVSGIVQTMPQFSHSLFEENFYSIYIGVERLSGYIDILPVTLPEALAREVVIGKQVGIIGQLRSYNKFIDGASRLILTVFAKELDFNAQTKCNEICLDGYICKPVVYRTTPFQREIADLLLAVNRQYSKSDYIPCIAWGRNARECKPLSVGDRLKIVGRIQSREYEKQLPDGSACIRTAYEVSISNLEFL